MADLSNKGDQDVRIRKTLISVWENTIAANTLLSQNRNSMSCGTVFIASGVTVTIPAENAVWFITEVLS